MAFLWRKHAHELNEFPWKLLMLGDCQAPHEAKACVAAEFKCAAPCCLPAGLARTLRQSGQDVQSPGSVSLLYWTGKLLRLTIADVEVRHARNATSAGRSGNVDFSGIVAQYVLAEYSELRRAGVMAATSTDPGIWRGNRSVGRNDDGGRLTEQRQVMLRAAGTLPKSQPPRRGKTALQLFAADRDFSHLKDDVRHMAPLAQCKAMDDVVE